ncbi:PQQ-binding-like beta-propeller repeat protein [Kitasatospora sp. NPDC089797]|uniref:PQQ-binding-like beta-propeller repeat protein n=1 Tax=Kitasatospora sp. NPDC089797 TaxID=3155298 RepID=UPI003424BA41
MNTKTAQLDPTPPAIPPVAAPQFNRRRLLLSAAGGLGALAVGGGAAWWARRDAARGPRLWNSAAMGGRVVLPSGAQQGLFASGYDGSVRSLDPATGAVRWSRVVKAAPPVNDLDGWQLANSGGWHAAAGEGVVCVVSTAGVQTLDAATGEPRWEVPLPEWPETPETSGPAIGAGGVFVVHGAALHCYDPATGALRWSGDPGVTGVLRLAGDAVYVAGKDGGLVALDARTGARLWTQDALGAVEDPPAVHRGLVYVGYSGGQPDSYTAFGLDAATGGVRWQRSRLPVAGPLAAADRTVCLLSGDRLMGLDADTGDTRWTADVPVGLGSGVSSMTAADGAVYVGTNDDRLLAFELATGQPRWRDEPDRIASDTEYTRVFLAATGSAVYCGTRTGLHALRAPAAA